MHYFRTLVLVPFVVATVGCGQAPDIDIAARDYSATFSELPQRANYPTDNPYNLAKEQLGEFLFWDPILSGARNVACASCHHPDFGWADGRAFSIGSDGIGLGPSRLGEQHTPIHSPSILNTAFAGLGNEAMTENFVATGYFWDLRAATLEEQSLGPIENPVEMLGYIYTPAQILPEIVSRLAAIEQYPVLFEQAFGSTQINSQRIAQALATFERKIISPNSRFDEFMAGDSTAFTADEIAGLNKFIDVGCARCHLGPLLSDNTIDVVQPVIIGKDAVRTPSLRNISITAPYMHDGSISTLQEVIAFYEDRDDLEVTMADEDVAIIEIFLKTLDSDNFYQSQPDYVPSGLPVGGD